MKICYKRRCTPFPRVFPSKWAGQILEREMGSLLSRVIWERADSVRVARGLDDNDDDEKREPNPAGADDRIKSQRASSTTKSIKK